MKRSKPPTGRRTPGLRREGPDASVPALPTGLPSWMAKGRALAEALEAALQTGLASPKHRAAVERAYAAWNLEGISPQQVARTAHLAHRAHEAIRTTSRGALETAYTDCARILHMGLPSALKRKVPLETVIEAVRSMRREADSWVAVVDATAHIVGWDAWARTHAAEAVRQALEEFPPAGEGGQTK